MDQLWLQLRPMVRALLSLDVEWVDGGVHAVSVYGGGFLSTSLVVKRQ
jgi:hypothetical protein